MTTTAEVTMTLDLKHGDLLRIEGARWMNHHVFTMDGWCTKEGLDASKGRGRRVALSADAAVIDNHGGDRRIRFTVSVGQTVRIQGALWSIRRPGFCEGDSCQLVPLDDAARAIVAAEIPEAHYG